MSMQVISQNVMSWEMEGGALFAERRPLMKKAVQGADVIGFQEVIPFWKDAFDQDLPEYDSILVYRSETNLEATPIYWKKERFEKKDAGHFWLSETPEKESFGWGAACVRICCWVLLHDKQDDKDFIFVNTHLDHVSEEARIKGIQQICEFIRSKFGETMPLLLTGDFNAVPGTPTIDAADALLTDVRKASGSNNFENTYHGYGKNEGCCIDFIYMNRQLDCSKFEVIKERDGQAIQSDHFGLRAAIEWK